MFDSLKKYKQVVHGFSKKDLENELVNLFKEDCFLATQHEKSTTNEAKRHYRKCLDLNNAKMECINELLDSTIS